MESGYRIAFGERHNRTRLATPEFILHVLIHALPDMFHDMRNPSPLAGSPRKATIAKISAFLLEGFPDAAQDRAIAQRSAAIHIRKPLAAAAGRDPPGAAVPIARTAP